VLAFAILGAVAAFVLIVLSVTARSEPLDEPRYLPSMDAQRAPLDDGPGAWDWLAPRPSGGFL